MNYCRLRELVFANGGTKEQLVRKANINRLTLDKALAGSDIKVSTLEKIATALDKPVGYFFDEPFCSVHTEGNNSPASYSGTASVIMNDVYLSERVKSLETLLSEKDQRIAELCRHLDELRRLLP